MATTHIPASVAATFPAMGARRLLMFGGIALIAAGIAFSAISSRCLSCTRTEDKRPSLTGSHASSAAQNPSAVKAAFARIGDLLEDRGTKVDTHVHMIDAGYLALLLALIQPYVALSAASKKLLARLFLIGALLLPLGIFLIHYIGLAYSPFSGDWMGQYFGRLRRSATDRCSDRRGWGVLELPA